MFKTTIVKPTGSETRYFDTIEEAVEWISMDENNDYDASVERIEDKK